MKRSMSAPCLVNEENELKKIKSADNQTEPNGKEYLQLALAKILELQHQIRDGSYITDNTSDLGDSDSEEDLMKEVLTKVFKNLPGSSSYVTSILNKVGKPQPSQFDVIRSKSIQLSGYDMCRRVTIEFMRNVVKFTPKTQEDLSKFQSGVYSTIEAKTASHRGGLVDNQETRSSDKIVFNDYHRVHEIFKILRSADRLGSKDDHRYENHDNPTIAFPEQNLSLRVAEELTGDNRNVNRRPNIQNSTGNEHREGLSNDYQIRIRMLRGLDLHLAAKQRDYTAKLMRH